VNTAQRIVLVIALGIALVAIAGAVNLLMLDRVGPGWFAYAPNTGVTFSPSETDTYFAVATDRSIMEQAGVWLLALATWAGASLWLLRTRPQGGPDD
jgi:hypothetical protein